MVKQYNTVKYNKIVFASKEIILDMFFRPAVFSFSCVLTIDRTLTSLFPDAFVLEILNNMISKTTTGQALYLYQCNFLFFFKSFFPWYIITDRFHLCLVLENILKGLYLKKCFHISTYFTSTDVNLFHVIPLDLFYYKIWLLLWYLQDISPHGIDV